MVKVFQFLVLIMPGMLWFEVVLMVCKHVLRLSEFEFVSSSDTRKLGGALFTPTTHIPNSCSLPSYFLFLKGSSEASHEGTIN